ncbi:hypothetical protein RI543_004593 [Arxiozyma heterogenica]|uniref:NET1-associated nuclear protein 1 n=1 Tax=Arxiozyma heterogenica TaxID=278026 RepID=A0AAN7ZRH8_9SACH|nr:hypothetical protein RI543_004593 [Kazachstania heterogenica]
MVEIQNYNSSVVSGGAPILPLIANGINYGNTISNNKNISILTHDQLHYIVPFNNQLKVYSLDTRQLITNKGQIVVLKYKGKLDDDLKIIDLNADLKLSENNGNVVKLFYNTDLNQFKIMVSYLNNKNSSYNYKLFDLNLDNNNNHADIKVNLYKEWSNVFLINWSNDNNIICLLHKLMGKKNSEKLSGKFFTITDIFKSDRGSYNIDIPFSNVFNEKNMTLASANNNNNSLMNSTNNQYTINKFVTALAIDNSRSQLAVGFASGVITIVSINDNIASLQNLELRYLKWHIDSVLSLAFNNDGSYLISGGWEKVLSFWQLSTNQQQFLPRLNGIVIDSKVVGPLGKYYSITLQLTENTTNNDYQILLLNSIDLTSKISIMGPMPIFQQQLSNVIIPTSTQNLNSSNVSTIKKHLKKLNKMMKNTDDMATLDFTTSIEVHPVTKQLYIPHGQALQRFDFYKNESTNLQFLTDGVQMHMGKVRNELRTIMDPQIKLLKITNDGKWLVTYEVEYPPKDLLSSNDLIHVLKFWCQPNNDNKDGVWELKTKVINPHGINVPIIDMICGNHESSLLTADNNGGIKYWKFDDYENNWCLKKILDSNFNHFNNSVNLQWSDDQSLIFHSFDDKLQIIDFDTFKLWVPPSESNITNEFSMDSQIQCLQLINQTNLIVVTMTSLLVLDLLLGKIVNGFDLYPYINTNFKNSHLKRLISCDYKDGKIVLVINQRDTNQCDDGDDKRAKMPNIQFKSNILVFNANLTHQLGKFTHDQYIAWIGWNHDTDFFFIDIDSRLGIVSTTMNTEIADEVNKEGILDGLSVGLTPSYVTDNIIAQNNYLDELRKLAASKKIPLEQQINSDRNRPNIIDEDINDTDLDVINGEKTSSIINMNSFSNMFENIQDISMTTLFENVIKTLN